MSARRTPRWTSAEVAILREAYPTGGMNAALERLPHRSWRSIHVKAHKLGIRCDMLIVGRANRQKLGGNKLEEAIRLREGGWSFARIGAHIGFCEASVASAVLCALCERRGFKPAERGPNGRFTAEGRRRLRYALKKGLKAVDIQLRLGVSASTVAHERRRYNAELKAAGKALLPPPGGGAPYSGVKLTRQAKREVEALLLEGYGHKKVNERTGVSKTSIGRIRNRLIARLRRRGQCLPGCDISGVRHVHKESVRTIPEETRAKLRELILSRVPVRRAAHICGIGTCSAYRIRDELKDELGAAFPTPRLPGRTQPLQREMMAAQAVPPEHLFRFRRLVHEHGDTEARRLLRAEIVEARRNRTFEERLAAVASGKAIIVPVRNIRAPTMEGGLGSSAAACVEAA